MASLSNVYEQHFGVVGSRRRIYIGTAIFLLGIVIQLIAVFAATTELAQDLFALKNWEAWEVAGILAGLGVPFTFAGLISVMPLSERLQRRVGIGMGISIVGVLFFIYAFPTKWHGDVPNYSLYVVLTYMTGCGLVLSYAFRTIATVKLRNNPGGTVRLNVEDKRDTSPSSEPDVGSTPSTPMGGGGIGVSKDTALDYSEDGDASDKGVEIMDGGEDEEQSEPYEQTQQRSVGSPHDEYCGSCGQFEYLQRGGKMVPYCHLHEEELDDLEACSEWEPNSYSQH